MGNRKRQSAQALKEAKKNIGLCQTKQLSNLTSKDAFGCRSGSWRIDR